ncbi:MAG: hypothetical protein EBS66_10790 [Betaproteobacteria bacterium]|nr:hypothetical protein [Betaproteobacteria bacterium]
MSHPNWEEWLASVEETVENLPSSEEMHDPMLTDEVKREYEIWIMNPDNRKNALKPIPSGPNMSFTAILDEIQDLHDKKSSDYGREVDPYANVRASEDFGIPAWVGTIVRANDKMRRLQKFAAEGNLSNESVEDSLIDLAVYAVIALDLYRQQTSADWRDTWS